MDGINIDNTNSPLVSAITLTKLDIFRNKNGVFVVAKGPVTLNNFRTSEGSGDGVNIDATKGSGAVTLAYSYGLYNETNNNAGYGYSILSNGAVTVTNVNSRHNGKDGGYINNSTAPTAAAVTVNKVGPVDDNNGYWENGAVLDTEPEPTDFGGLRILSRGAVSVLRTISDNNAGPGLVIKNVPAEALPGVPVTVNSGDFSGNDSNGLEITSRGAVSLTSVWTMSNKGFGTTIFNDPLITTMAGAAVTITDSGFNGNFIEDLYSDENGLMITSKGLVTLTNISANGNDGFGTAVNNKSGTAGVTINATAGKGNSFSNNLLDGLKIETNGAVMLTNIRATDNILYDDFTGDILAGGYGVNIDNCTFDPDSWSCTGTGSGAVTIKQLGGWGGDGYWTDGNTFSGNNGMGLSITTKGTVNVTFYNASDNKDTGIYIYALNGPGTVTVNGAANSWDNLSYNWGDGLSIESKGLITVTNIKANDNGGYGAFFNNAVDPKLSVAGVTLNALPGTGNEFQSNGLDGLRILSNGAVTLTNIYASGSEGYFFDPVTGYGVNVDNSTGNGAVTFKQVGSWGGRDFWTDGNVFSDNSEDGLWIKTKGAVTVPFYQAKNNGGAGIFIDAQGGVGAVTVGGTTNYDQNLCFNVGYGLDITAKGNISASNFDACLNEAGGATFTNSVPGGTGSVTLTNADFLENFGSGVYVRSAGAMTWKNGTTYNNWGLGADIDNTFGIAKAVSLTNITSNNNQETGLKILSNGLVTITDSVSESNSVNNKYLDYYDEWADNLGNNVEQAWWFDGLIDEEVTIQVLSDRLDPTLYLTDVNGYYIDSTWTVGSDGFAELTFTVPEDGVFQIVVGAMNSYPGWGYNIKIYEGLYDPDRIFNFQESLANGIYVDNTTSSTNAGVTITNANGAWNSNNSDTNVVIKSKGAVSLLDMYISDSGHGGLDIDNSSAPVGLTPGVTLSWMGIDNNDGNGVSINTKGAVTVTGVGTTGNRGYGLTALTSGAFTVTAPADAWNYFDNNLLGGLNVEAGGIITVNRAYAGKNGQVYGMGTIKDSYGIKLISSNGSGTSPVTLTDGWIYENTLDGVKIITKAR